MSTPQFFPQLAVCKAVPSSTCHIIDFIQMKYLKEKYLQPVQY